MNRFTVSVRGFGRRAAALLVLAATISPAQALAQTSTSTQRSQQEFSCANTEDLDVRATLERRPARAREVAPRAGNVQSADLYTHGRLTATAYAMFDAFADGEDPRIAFNQPSLRLAALVLGDPGPDDEGLGRRLGRRTFYGFVADEVGTGRRYVVFRGTQIPAEWVRNLQSGQRPYPIGSREIFPRARVHAGFLTIFESLLLDGGTGLLTDDLASLVAGRDVVFVGHSLGGALATLAGVEASRRSPKSAPRLRVVTLASPRVGDAGFAAMAANVGRIDRVCNLVDLVPAAPPSTAEIQYMHVGKVHKVSSFDWPQLANNLDASGAQIGCWHADTAYAYMLLPSPARLPPSPCSLPAR